MCSRSARIEARRGPKTTAHARLGTKVVGRGVRWTKVGRVYTPYPKAHMRAIALHMRECGANVIGAALAHWRPSCVHREHPEGSPAALSVLVHPKQTIAYGFSDELVVTLLL